MLSISFGISLNHFCHLTVSRRRDICNLKWREQTMCCHNHKQISTSKLYIQTHCHFNMASTNNAPPVGALTDFSFSKGDAPCEWPPTFQSFEEYKAELDEAIDAHPPFGVWLRMHRNVSHLTDVRFCGGRDAAWHLPVQRLKERYLQSANLHNHTKNAKRVFIEMHLEENKATYEKDESELTQRLESHALAVDIHDQAIRHGYRKISRPPCPSPTRPLMERDKLQEQLKKLVLSVGCGPQMPPHATQVLDV